MLHLQHVFGSSHNCPPVQRILRVGAKRLLQNRVAKKGNWRTMATANSAVQERSAQAGRRQEARRERADSGIVGIVAVFQGVMFAAHWFVYETLRLFFSPLAPAAHTALAVGFAVLSVSFVSATLLAFRYNNFPLRMLYRTAAVWLGALNYFFLAALLSWAAYGLVLDGALKVSSSWIALVLFGLATVFSFWGVLNANWVRVRKITVKLANLPDAWRGRTAVLASDLHLGHVHHRGFSARIVRKISALRPDVVFLAGDLFDGTHVNAPEVAAPFRFLRAPFGTFFATGNHELFRGESQYLDAIRKVGIRDLQNEKVDLNGFQIVGVPYHHATHAEHFRSVLAKIAIDPTRASILLTHAPDRPAITAEAGIGLQLSGHTHLGQFFPFTWITRRIYRKFTYGLGRLGDTQFYVSSGVGTWGPPLRIGSQSEIVRITFE